MFSRCKPISGHTHTLADKAAIVLIVLFFIVIFCIPADIPSEYLLSNSAANLEAVSDVQATLEDPIVKYYDTLTIRISNHSPYDIAYVPFFISIQKAVDGEWFPIERRERGSHTAVDTWLLAGQERVEEKELLSMMSKELAEPGLYRIVVPFTYELLDPEKEQYTTVGSGCAACTLTIE